MKSYMKSYQAMETDKSPPTINDEHQHTDATAVAIRDKKIVSRDPPGRLSETKNPYECLGSAEEAHH